MPFLKYLLLLPVTLIILLFSSAQGIISPVEPNDVPPQAQRPGINDRLGPSGGEFPSVFDPYESKDYIAIPGTNMKAGAFFYEFTKEDGGYANATKGGILVNDSVLYYVEADDRESLGVFDPSGIETLGVYRDYLVMDGWASGAHHNRRLFLFRLGKDSVELLDVIMESAFHEGNAWMSLDFMLSPGKGGNETWTDIKDLDNDGNPEIRVRIDEGFDLYFEIKDDRLQVDLNPALYKPLFEKARRKSRPDNRPDAYYVYGLFSGSLSRESIKATVKYGRWKWKSWFLNILNGSDLWIKGFHDFDGAKPVLIRHELTEKGKKGGR